MKAVVRAIRGHARRRLPLSSVVAKCARYYLYQYHNENHNVVENGEGEILARLRAVNPKVIFDVGANKGSWAALASALHPSASIHAFEIVPETASLMVATAGPGVIVNTFGLADCEATVIVNYYERKSTVSTMILDKGVHKESFVTKECRVITGDKYCRESYISRIDLLKIDVEGADHLVLKGFKEWLVLGRIDVIQFEYGLSSVYSRFLLKDFYEMLSPYYHLGRLLPHGVEVTGYRPRDENFRSGNFVAIHRSRPHIRALLETR